MRLQQAYQHQPQAVEAAAALLCHAAALLVESHLRGAAGAPSFTTDADF